MNTSALLTRGFSRKRTLLRTLRSSGAALTVVMMATIDRCLSVQVLPKRWHVFVVLRPLRSETLRPRTSPLGDWTDFTGQVASTQTLHPHLVVINCAQVRMHGQTPTSLLKPDKLGINRPAIVILSLSRAGARRRSGELEAQHKGLGSRGSALKGVFPSW